MAQTQLNTKDLTGFNIYHTKNQTIYWDRFTKTAYIISKSDVASFSTWQLKAPLAVMLSMILILFGTSYSVAFTVAIVAYIVATIIFRVKYLPGLPVSLKWQKPKSEGFIRDTAYKFSFSSIVLMAIMFAIFAVMFGIDVVFYRSSEVAFIVYLILLIASVVAGIISVLVAIARKKIEKEQKNTQK